MKKFFTCLLLTFGLVGPVVISSCADEPIKPKTKTELLCSAPWKLSSLMVNPGIDIGGVVVTDFLTQLEPCDVDDLNIYKVDGKGISDEGPTKCIASSPQTTSFTWVFSPDETKITENNTDTYDVLQLDENAFKISIIVDGADIGGVDGLKYKLTSGYKH